MDNNKLVRIVITRLTLPTRTYDVRPYEGAAQSAAFFASLPGLPYLTSSPGDRNRLASIKGRR